ncbi:MAG: hypothetical protein WCT47_17445 [Betaproteobacteria bacterium]|jgi:heterotetrameric sarcosine oxidase gamma subunit
MVDHLDASSLVDTALLAALPAPTGALAARVVEGLRVLVVRHLPGGQAAIEATVAAVAAPGLVSLPSPGAFRGVDPWLVWTGPAECLLLTSSSTMAEGVLQGLAPGREALACALDQSAGHLVLELSGLGVAESLHRLFDAGSIPHQVGQGSRARLMDIGAVLLRLAPDRVLLVLDRTHGLYVAQWITHALQDEGALADARPLR